MAHLSLTLLGSFQATLDGEPLTGFRSAKVQGLLVYLALTEEQPHAREVLAALFWPEEPEAVARKNLRQSLYQLRQVLGDADPQEMSFLLVSRSAAQFNPDSDHTSDVTGFLGHLGSHELEQAATLYQGELVPGFTCDSLPFEEWLRQERERLHRLALDALFELATRSLARADYHTAQSLARRQLALEPWREEAHRQLMQALALLGERSAALAQYEACRRVLEEELGVEPGAETEALLAHIIRDQQPGRGQPVRLLERRRLTTPFVGRHSEHGALVRAYQQARRDGVQVATLLGEAGIGKTRLAQEFLDWAATQGADILRGRAFETSGRLSYQPLTQVLRQRLERENAPEDLLSDLWLTQLTRILPELRDRYPDLPEPTQEEATARQHLFEAIARLGQALAERAPLVIFIDDWHWADAASLDVLHYAALRWSEERAPILVLLTLRQEAPAEAPDLQAWLTRLNHDVACVQLHLAALSGAETEQLMRNLLEPEEEVESAPADGFENRSQLTRFSRWLFEETDGQPLFLVETLKALMQQGLFQPDMTSAAWRVDWARLDEQALGPEPWVAPRVQEIIQGWLERISAPADELLTAAAVLGQEASFDNLCRVTGLEEAQALTALDELLAEELLREAEGASPAPGHEPTYSFSHHKLGEVVYAEAGAARRRILHRRAFEALQAIAAPAAELAHQAFNGGLWAEAMRYSIVAGNDAMRLFAVRVAITHYEAAWQLAEQIGWPEAISGADRQDLYASLGRAYELVEAWPRAGETYQALIAYAETIGATALECLGLNRLATVYINGFKDPGQAIAILERARTVAEENGDRRGLADTEWNLSTAARMQQETRLALHHGEQALAIARELGHPQLLARCLNSLAYVHSRLRQWEMVEAYASEASELYAAAGNRVLEADSQRLVGWSQMYSGRPRDSLVTLEETFAFSQGIENLWGQAECAWRLALTLLELGRYGEAIRIARQAVKQARTVGMPTMVLLALSTWGRVQRTVMALEAAQETLWEAQAEAAEKGLTGYGDWVLGELCTLHVISGDWGEAQVYARQALQSREDGALLPLGLTGWYETEALLRGGDEDLARAEVERLDGSVGNNQRYRLPLLRSQAVLAQWDGDTGQAISRLEAAAALAREMGLPGEECSILGALGGLYVEQGDQAKAQQACKASGDISHSLAESIDDEDLRAGFLKGVHRIGHVSKHV
jgi:DNA-binding SARP family transcriptional activator/tetratricopeptide (TPR) repeat protein